MSYSTIALAVTDRIATLTVNRPDKMNAMVAAHPSYPFDTLVRVTNLRNGRSVELRILDRGPAAGPRRDGVIIDVSQGAARSLGFVAAGRTRVRVDVLRWGRRTPGVVSRSRAARDDSNQA